MDEVPAMQLFDDYGSVVEDFRLAHGLLKITLIRSPRDVANKYRAAFPAEAARKPPRYCGIPIEIVDTQNHVSVRATTSAGQEFEYPEPP